MNSLLKLAKKAAVEAGRAIMFEYDKSFSVRLKGDRSPVTSADLAANDKIYEILSASGISICSEESVLETRQRQEAEIFWLVDPLDGTKEFIDKNGDFCVCIALIEAGKAVLGVIFVPTTAELFYASSAGVFMERLGAGYGLLEILNLNKSAKNEKNIYLSRRSKNAVGKEIASTLGLKTHTIGSAIKFARLVQNGGAYVRISPSYIWDNAAGDALVRLSGGVVLDADSLEPINYASKSLKSPHFICLSKDMTFLLDDIVSIVGRFNLKS
ncbi:3'(2'),5'-bisphosphate nucleotidase CysQ [Campylobacter sp. 19-13652]|uniref:3'(2'),5'-bisphosphate nucleotidase CysQ family protein n=1 Tax=Campylobacter sp. 19-13652 TaxID=2840180 RepID=UPI001C74DCDE|nr:3'(2'),5'-bisphosphate nucleotidase CysQ [Campylobacter sp. 19-13652]BCX78832.1 3'(2'),5'-bisphosphate nucleotidase CysQ [Campylobacter sp. 19-13652]